MNHVLIYASGATELTFNVDWPDNASFMPPPEIVLTNEATGVETTYTYRRVAP